MPAGGHDEEYDDELRARLAAALLRASRTVKALRRKPAGAAAEDAPGGTDRLFRGMTGE